MPKRNDTSSLNMDETEKALEKLKARLEKLRIYVDSGMASAADIAMRDRVARDIQEIKNQKVA